jgi:hypothetical protein
MRRLSQRGAHRKAGSIRRGLRGQWHRSGSTLAVTASDLLRVPKVAEAIKARETKRNNKRILTREERQAFWSSVADDENQNILARLKASELLGKSEADFVERQRHEGVVSIQVVNPYAGALDE